MDQHKRHSEEQGTGQEPEDILVNQHTSEIPIVSAVDGRRPAPFVPDFAWRPGLNDYPVALISSSSTAKRRAQAGGAEWEGWPTLETVGQHRTPIRYIPYAVAVAALGAVILSNGFWLDRINPSSDADDDPVVAVVDDNLEADGTTTTESLLNRSQQPGQGGDEADATATTDADDATPTNGASESTSEPKSTATSESPMIPDPSVSTADTDVAKPDAGVSTYEISGNESLYDVANMFNVSIPTLLWPNDIEDPRQFIEEGTEIIVPPVDGVLHKVAESDTIERIAARYHVDTSVIVSFEPNGIGGSPDLKVGQFVMVPGGQITDWGEVKTYTVLPGDNLWEIAEYYGLDPQTLVWANDLPRAELISPGQELIIPPGDGALIEVQAGDHVEAIAARFGVDPATIRNYGFNNLGGDRVLQVGQWLLVPGAPLPDPGEPSALDADSVAGEGAFNPATGSFLWPTNGFISQEFSNNHNGLDVANEEWTPVNAADGGIVIFAGWNDYGLGYAVGIDHGNGYQTWYGHLANTPYVVTGQVVWQGGYLGPMGTTGKSTGPHLHFIVMENGVYQDPLQYLE